MSGQHRYSSTRTNLCGGGSIDFNGILKEKAESSPDLHEVPTPAHLWKGMT